jgi:hypothetical protein
VSDTPRTDEAQFGTGRVSVGFARQLELELNAANDRIKRLEEAAMMALHGCYNGPMPDHVRDALADAMEAKP